MSASCDATCEVITHFEGIRVWPKGQVVDPLARKGIRISKSSWLVHKEQTATTDFTAHTPRELDPEKSREEFAVPALQNARVQTEREREVHLHARCQ